MVVCAPLLRECSFGGPRTGRIVWAPSGSLHIAPVVMKQDVRGRTPSTQAPFLEVTCLAHSLSTFPRSVEQASTFRQEDVSWNSDSRPGVA